MDMWDKFAQEAKQQEEQIAKQKEEEQRVGPWGPLRELGPLAPVWF